jgi:transcriptional regulator with XRE-family HTH domain
MKNARERVKERLKKAKRTQRDLASVLDVSESYLSELLSGKRRVSLEMALKLEQETGVPIRDFAQVA